MGRIDAGAPMAPPANQGASCLVADIRGSDRSIAAPGAPGGSRRALAVLASGPGGDDMISPRTAATTVLLFILLGVGHSAAAAPPLLLRSPTVSRTQICFSYAGDLWIVDRKGGDARRLTTGPGIESDPAFSPDGSLIAFTGEYTATTTSSW